MPLYPTFTTLAAELGDSIDRTLQKILGVLLKAPVSGTALTSAARSATTISANIPSDGCKGVVAYLNVTAASGTGGLTLRLISIDPLSGAVAISAAVSAAVTTTGLRVVHFGPGVGASSGAFLAGGGAGVMLGTQFALQVSHGDASSYTYSLAYEKIQ